MSGDNVSTTGADGRKQTSKPVMEKRRRARINACLVELKSLLMEVIKSEGARQSKMEKADILEMTVRHLRQLQRQSLTGSSSIGARSLDPTIPNKYRLGYTECINEVSRFLGSLDFEEVELRTKIIDHLANCVCSSKFFDDEVTTNTSIFPYNTAVVKPRVETFSSSDKSSTSVTAHTTHMPIAPKPEVFPETTSSFVLDIPHTGRPPEQTSYIYPSDQTIPRISATCSKDSGETEAALNLSTCPGQCVVTDPYISLPVASSGHIVTSPQPGVCNIQESEPSTQNTSQLQFIKQTHSTEETVQSNSSVQPISSFASASVFSGFHLVPTKLASGELAFVLPTNILPTTPTPSYIIPVFSQNIPTPTVRSQQQMTTSVSTVSVIPQNVLPISGIRPLILNPIPPTLQHSSTRASEPQSLSSVGGAGPNTSETYQSNQFKSNMSEINFPHIVHHKNNDRSSEQTLLNSQAGTGTRPRDVIECTTKTEPESTVRMVFTEVNSQCDTSNWSPAMTPSRTNDHLSELGTSKFETMGRNSVQRRPILNIMNAGQGDNGGHQKRSSDADVSELPRDQNNNAPNNHDDRDDDMWRPW